MASEKITAIIESVKGLTVLELKKSFVTIICKKSSVFSSESSSW